MKDNNNIMVYPQRKTKEMLATLEILENMDNVKIMDNPQKDNDTMLLPTMLSLVAGSMHPQLFNDLLGNTYDWAKSEKTEQDLLIEDEKKQKAQEKRNRKALKRLNNKV